MDSKNDYSPMDDHHGESRIIIGVVHFGNAVFKSA